MISYHNTLNLGLQSPRKILYYNHLYWLTSYNDNCVFILQKNLQEYIIKKKIILDNLKNPRGITHIDNKIYVACYGEPIGGIICFDATTYQEILYFNVARPRGIIAINKLLYITEVNQNRIGIYDEMGHNISFIGTHILNQPRGIDINHNNELIIADSGNNRIVYLDLVGNLIRIIDDTIESPNDVSCYKNKLYFSEWYKKTIRIYDEETHLLNNSSYQIPNGSGYLAMIATINNQLYISDDCLGCIHIYNI